MLGLFLVYFFYNTISVFCLYFYTMSNIIKTTDFVGRYRLSQNLSKTTDYQYIIDYFEPDYLEKLLGSWLYNELVTDLGALGVPQTEKYTNLVNGVTYVDCDGITQNYKGLKKMLLHLLFVDITLIPYYNSNVGNVIPMTESATVVSEYENKKILMPISQTGVRYYRETIKFLNDTDNQEIYFTDDEYINWCPVQIEPLTLIGTKTYENKHFKQYPHDRN